MGRNGKITAIILASLALMLAGVVSLRGATAGAAALAPFVAKDTALLAGDNAIGPAAGNQYAPQIAAGGGGYLVVWQDTRANPYPAINGNVTPSGGSPSGQTLIDIFAARLDATGQLIDTTPIAVSQASGDQTHPHVAWNGQNWLVVWDTFRPTANTYTVDVNAARVSPQGVVLDSAPIVLDATDSINEQFPVVSSDGTDWVVVWFDQGSYFELDAARVAPDGTVREPSGIPIYTPQFPNAPYGVSIAFAGDEYLLSWHQWGSNDDNIVGMRMSRTLQRIGPSFFTISAQPGYEVDPNVASNGTDFFVVWTDNRTNPSQIFGSRVTHAGVALDPNGIEISGYQFNGGSDKPSVTWDGAQWIVTWQDDRNGLQPDIFAARVSASGSVLDAGGFAVVANDVWQNTPAVAPISGGGARIVWADFRGVGSTPQDIYGASISATGQVGTEAPLSLGAPQQRQPDIAASNGGYLAVFLSKVSGENRIKAQRLDSTGNPVDAEPVLIAGGTTTIGNPAVAWNGSVFLVVWEDTSSGQGFVPGMIRGRRVQPNGAVLDATPITIMPGNSPDVAALGDTFLVVDSHEATNHIRIPKAARVSGAGSVLDATPITIGTSYSLSPHVSVLGDRWLVVYHHQPSHDNSRSSVFANFVAAGGAPASEFTVASDPNGIVPFKTPNLASGPTQALITYFKPTAGNAQNGDIFARRILTDGTLLDSSTGLQVTSAYNTQFLPSVAWDGSEYVIAYEDYRNVDSFLDKPVSDIYGSRVSSAGVVLDPNGFVVANARTPEINPVVAAGNGGYLVGYAAFKPGAPYASYRIEVQHGQAGGPPTPLPTSTTTVTSTVVSPTSTTVPASATASSTSLPATATASGTVVVATATASSTVVPATATATATVCTLQFEDVPPTGPGNTFYPFVRCLACKGIISGYQCGGAGEPCDPNNNPYFHPNNPVSRGQIAKIVAQSAGFTEVISPTQQTFEDVVPGTPFHPYVERLASRGIVGGYECGIAPNEPCIPPANRKYYRPDGSASRGQLAKIVSEAAGFHNTIPANQYTFTDVPPENAFWVYIERLLSNRPGVMSGYQCGGPGEPCDAQNRNYFRWGNPVTRGQASKIDVGTFFPGCAP